MRKPEGYDQAQASGDFTPANLGGHYAVIKQVSERQSSTGRDMVVVLFDFDQKDGQAGYFSDQFNRSDMLNRLGCGLYDNQSLARARNITLDEQYIVCSINFDDLQILVSGCIYTFMTSHHSAFVDVSVVTADSCQ